MELSEKTMAEMEAGKKYVLLHNSMEKIRAAEKKLQEAFPKLDIAIVLNKPYTHVSLRAVQRVPLAPIDSKAVLMDVPASRQYYDTSDPLEGFPSDHLVAQLALIA